MKRLNLGCGHEILDGYINLDRAALEGVDVVHDLAQLPLPFPNQEFDEILCNNILEHVQYIDVLRELHRIMKPGGRLKICVPHFTSRDNFIDPTHIKRFSFKTFEFFVKNSSFGRNYYFDFAFSSLDKVWLTYRKGIPFFYNYLVDKVINANPNIMNFYEMSGLCYMFPAADLHVILVK